MHWILLMVAIGAEVIATSLLQLTYGFTKLIPSLLVITGYAVSFYCLSLVIKTIPIGIAYALWSGLGIVLVATIAFLVYGQKLDFPAIIGLGFIILGAIVINLFSKSIGN